MAKKDGFKGLTFAGVANCHNMINENYDLFDYIIDKEPGIYWNTMYESTNDFLKINK